MKTKDALGFFFKNEKGEYEEVFGLSFYGLYKKGLKPEVIHSVYSLWNLDENNYKFSTIEYDDFVVFQIGIRLTSFDNELQWLNCVSGMLKEMIKHGAILAWCGGEDCSPNLEIFSYDKSAGNIYAAYDLKNNFVCNSGFNDELVFLDDSQLTMFKNDLIAGDILGKQDDTI
jgi:hypothetical protein